MARLVAQRFMTAWGQQVIVENRGGANHAIGAAMVGKAAPDGHSMMVARRDRVRHQSDAARGKLPYDVKDFAPVTGLVRINQGLLATSVAAGQQHRRADRAGEAEARRDHLRQLRPRRRRARQRRAAGEHGRHQAHAGALSRRDAGAERRAGRPHHAHLGQPQRVGAALSRRQGQDARGRQRSSACRKSPRCRPPPRPCRATRPSPGSACSPPPARRAR